MDDSDLGGRVYHLRPRLLSLEPPAGRVVPFSRNRPRALASVHVLPLKESGDERRLSARSQLEWAWAAHQRVYGEKDLLSFRRVISGAEKGIAFNLFGARVAAQALPDCEEWMESLQVDGRTVLQVFEAERRVTPAPDGHDCDCTCEGGEGHAHWELLPEDWRPVRVGALLQRLIRGELVRVRLAPK